MNRDDVIGYISKTAHIDAAQICHEMKFSELGINSIDFVELVMSIEEKTGKEFDEDRLSPVFFDSVGEFVDAVMDM